MPPTIDDILLRLPRWHGQPRTVTALSGGITNRNYRVEVAGEAFVVRLGGNNTELLGIDREQEYAATQAAAAIGIGPEVIDFLRPEGFLVARFIAGRPLALEAVRQPAGLARVAEALRQVHALPPIQAAFSPFRIVEAYEATARAHGVTSFPADFAWLRDRGREVEAACAREPFTPQLCHNDLLNENFLDDGAIRLIDWEYAGMGDVFFDLANFAVNHGLSEAQDEAFLDAYFSPAGGATPRQAARHKLMKIMSDFREAMWAMVQLGISELTFDFQGYADKHFARLTQSFNDPRYAGWLAALG